MLLIRRIGALVLVAAAVLVWFALEPDAPAKVDQAAAVKAIESKDADNNSLTEGAPQQTVVNGWTANNYLQLLSKQLDAAASADLARDDRPAALLVLVVAGVALLAFTTPGAAGAAPTFAPSGPDVGSAPAGNLGSHAGPAAAPTQASGFESSPPPPAAPPVTPPATGFTAARDSTTLEAPGGIGEFRTRPPAAPGKHI